MNVTPNFKIAPLRKPAYLEYVRGLPCLDTGTLTICDPHHIKLGWFAKSEKPPDDWVIPLRHDRHQLLHDRGEHSFYMQMIRDKQTCGHIMRLAARGLYLEWVIANMKVSP